MVWQIIREDILRADILHIARFFNFLAPKLYYATRKISARIIS